MTVTDAGGFYLFDNLDAGTYGVKFDLSTVPDVCTSRPAGGHALRRVGDEPRWTVMPIRQLAELLPLVF